MCVSGSGISNDSPSIPLLPYWWTYCHLSTCSLRLVRWWRVGFRIQLKHGCKGKLIVIGGCSKGRVQRRHKRSGSLWSLFDRIAWRLSFASCIAAAAVALRDPRWMELPGHRTQLVDWGWRKREVTTLLMLMSMLVRESCCWDERKVNEEAKKKQSDIYIRFLLLHV